jgi:hypothetical protein
MRMLGGAAMSAARISCVPLLGALMRGIVT